MHQGRSCRRQDAENAKRDQTRVKADDGAVVPVDALHQMITDEF